MAKSSNLKALIGVAADETISVSSTQVQEVPGVKKCMIQKNKIQKMKNYAGNDPKKPHIWSFLGNSIDDEFKETAR